MHDDNDAPQGDSLSAPTATAVLTHVVSSIVDNAEAVRVEGQSSKGRVKLQVKVGAYLILGQGGEGSCFLHNTRYDFYDDFLPHGAALHASLVGHGLPL